MKKQEGNVRWELAQLYKMKSNALQFGRQIEYDDQRRIDALRKKLDETPVVTTGEEQKQTNEIPF